MMVLANVSNHSQSKKIDIICRICRSHSGDQESWPSRNHWEAFQGKRSCVLSHLMLPSLAACLGTNILTSEILGPFVRCSFLCCAQKLIMESEARTSMVSLVVLLDLVTPWTGISDACRSTESLLLACQVTLWILWKTANQCMWIDIPFIHLPFGSEIFPKRNS